MAVVPILVDNFDEGIRITNPNSAGDPTGMWMDQATHNNSNAVTSPTFQGTQACHFGGPGVAAPQWYCNTQTGSQTPSAFWNYVRELSYDITNNGKTWTFDRYNRMRWFVIPSTGLGFADDHSHTLEVGTFLLRNGDPRSNNSGETFNNHWYHFYNIGYVAAGVWTQIILDSHPNHLRTNAGNAVWSDQIYDVQGQPTACTNPGFNYFDALNNYYQDWVGGHPSGDYYMDLVQFYQDDRTIDTEHVYSLCGFYQISTNRLRVGWRHKKGEIPTHTVRYAFTSLYTIGFTSGTVVTAAGGADDVNVGHVLDTTAISMGANPVIYIGIQQTGQSGFAEISIPLQAGVIPALPGEAGGDTLAPAAPTNLRVITP